MDAASPLLRTYHDHDAASWLRCRLLGFFDTQHYDDVAATRPALAEPTIALVAVDESSQVLGLLDIETEGTQATITTVAVHPDHQRRGIATALLTEALPRVLATGAQTLDAWTRQDHAANAWYLAHGFSVTERYLHVHQESEDEAGASAIYPLSAPVRGFYHARLRDRGELEGRFSRLYECRQYLRHLT